jgi:hypothetical protein
LVGATKTASVGQQKTPIHSIGTYTLSKEAQTAFGDLREVELCSLTSYRNEP